MPLSLILREGVKFVGKESVLLLFDEKRPFWNRKLVEMAGEDPSVLDDLAAEGLLERVEKGFCLTGTGRERFGKWAAESWLESNPGAVPDDPDLEGMKLETALLFERSFRGFQGTKKITVSPDMEIFPDVPPRDLFQLRGEDLQWHFDENPRVSMIREIFPRDREPGEEGLDKVEERVDGTGTGRVPWSPHLLCVNQCDYVYYWRSRVDTDRWGLLNTDRLFLKVIKDPGSFDLEEAAMDMALFSLFLLDNRHVYLPGCFDIDVHQQSAFTWWFWATETQEEARSLASRLGTLGRDLVSPAEPTDAWTISLEALNRYDRKADSFYEFVDDLAIPVTRGGA